MMLPYFHSSSEQANQTLAQNGTFAFLSFLATTIGFPECFEVKVEGEVRGIQMDLQVEAMLLEY